MLAGYACSWPGLWTLPLAMESPLNMAHAGASPQPELPRVHGSALFESSPDLISPRACEQEISRNPDTLSISEVGAPAKPSWMDLHAR